MNEPDPTSGSRATDRGYLSIGEVLLLLQDEFPDVTISKIRFLESQGLIEPERTPSGYRKFFDSDVERLRYILREQKDHYLPLRVIKHRLESEPTGPLSRLLDPTDPEGLDATAAGERTGEIVAGRAGAGAAESDRGSTATGDDSRNGTAPHGGALGRDATAATGSERGEEEVAASRREAAAVGPAGSPVAGGQDPGSGAGDAGQRPAGEGAGREPAGEAGAGSAPAAGSATAGSATGRRREGEQLLGAEEIRRRTGLSATELRELEQFGLVTSRLVSGEVLYPEEEIEVARTTVAFLRRGVEARHLRMYRQAVEREISLFEQMVMPYLKQRNPQARKLAAETLEELAAAGGDLRAALVRNRVRDLLEG